MAQDSITWKLAYQNWGDQGREVGDSGLRCYETMVEGAEHSDKGCCMKLHHQQYCYNITLNKKIANQFYK